MAEIPAADSGGVKIIPYNDDLAILMWEMCPFLISEIMEILLEKLRLWIT